MADVTNLSLRPRPRTKWTAEKLAKACDLRAAGLTDLQVGEAVGMSASAVFLALDGVPRPMNEAQKKRKSVAESERRTPPADNILTDRTARLEAADRRDFTAAFFGDPPPGYSARDGKVGMT